MREREPSSLLLWSNFVLVPILTLMLASCVSPAALSCLLLHLKSAPMPPDSHAKPKVSHSARSHHIEAILGKRNKSIHKCSSLQAPDLQVHGWQMPNRSLMLAHARCSACVTWSDVQASLPGVGSLCECAQAELQLVAPQTNEEVSPTSRTAGRHVPLLRWPWRACMPQNAWHAQQCAFTELAINRPHLIQPG